MPSRDEIRPDGEDSRANRRNVFRRASIFSRDGTYTRRCNLDEMYPLPLAHESRAVLLPAKKYSPEEIRARAQRNPPSPPSGSSRGNRENNGPYIMYILYSAYEPPILFLPSYLYALLLPAPAPTEREEIYARDMRNAEGTEDNARWYTPPR